MRNIFFGYTYLCRSCPNPSPIKHGLNITLNEDKEYYGYFLEEYDKLTECDVAQIIYWTRVDNEMGCQFCGSTRVQINDVEVNSKKLFDLEKIIATAESNEKLVVIISANKNLNEINGDFEIKGSKKFYPKSLIFGLQQINTYFTSNARIEYKERPFGGFYACATVSKSENEIVEFDVKVQRLQHWGMDLDNIVEVIKGIAYNLKVYSEVFPTQRDIDEF
jgi:hypothetical protein